MPPDDEQGDQDDATRRGVLTAIAAGALAVFSGLTGYFTGSADAQTPAGDVGTTSNPYRRAHVDRVVFTARTSDPSSPPDGTFWYNESA